MLPRHGGDLDGRHFRLLTRSVNCIAWPFSVQHNTLICIHGVYVGESLPFPRFRSEAISGVRRRDNRKGPAEGGLYFSIEMVSFLPQSSGSVQITRRKNVEGRSSGCPRNLHEDLTIIYEDSAHS